MRRLLYGLGALVLLLVIAAGGVYWFLSGDGLRLALERQATAWLGHPVQIGDAHASLFPRVAVRLQDVRVSAAPEQQPALTLQQVDLATSLGALLRRRIEDAEVIISGSRIEMPLPFELPVTSASSPSPGAAAAAAAGGGIELVSVRAITLRDVVIASRGREIALSAESSLEGTRLAVQSLRARAEDTVIDASGHVDLQPRVSATIDATANQLNIDDLLALAAAFTTDGGAGGTSTGAPAAITATITAPQARVADVPLARFEASVRADGPELRIEPLKFDVFGGRYDGWLDVAIGDMLDVRVGAGIANLDVAQLAAYGGAEDAITGRMSGSGRFGARGRDMAQVLAAARGVGEVSLTGGAIRHLDVVRTVLLFFGRPGAEAPPAAGEQYTAITGTFALAQQSVRSDDLTLRSPDFDIFARGSLALPTQALDARADLVVSEALSAQAGRDLYRFTRAGNRIVLPAVIGGTLSQPSVRIDAGAAVRRGLRNEVERRLQDLFEQIPPALP